jgi:hypothetical protein
LHVEQPWASCFTPTVWPASQLLSLCASAALTTSLYVYIVNSMLVCYLLQLFTLATETLINVITLLLWLPVGHDEVGRLSLFWSIIGWVSAAKRVPIIWSSDKKQDHLAIISSVSYSFNTGSHLATGEPTTRDTDNYCYVVLLLFMIVYPICVLQHDCIVFRQEFLTENIINWWYTKLSCAKLFGKAPRKMLPNYGCNTWTAWKCLYCMFRSGVSAVRMGEYRLIVHNLVVKNSEHQLIRLVTGNNFSSF